MSSLEDKVVCITGASRGLGQALAQACDAAGARLVLGARTLPDLEAVAGACRDALFLQTDVRIASEVDALVNVAVTEFGQLDVMINNAGLAIYGPVETLSAAEVDEVVDTNIKGVIYGSQAAFRHMKDRRSGHIVNIGSVAGKLHLPNEAVYNASKWAVTGFTGTLRLEAENYGVKVTHVCPGGMHTPFWRQMDFYPFPDTIDPERDFMKPEDVARSVIQVLATPGAYAVPELVMVPMIPR
jgi:NADP-dependent 3-hydroxy acid dehydrogenase YdfG